MTLSLALLVAAFVVFVIAAWRNDGRIIAAGLAVWVLSALVSSVH
jgi:hypothetical protein